MGSTNTYVMDQAWAGEKERLGAISALHDPFTMHRLEALGIQEGWRCAEVGAGAGSIALWLADHVGTSGKVIATDRDPRFLQALNHPSLEIRRHDIVAESLEESAYDFVHARLLLMHVADRERALGHILRAVRPGGRLLLEDGDFRNYQVSSPPSEVLRATGQACVRLMEGAGADPQYGTKLYAALSAAGLQHIDIAGQQVVMPCGTPSSVAFTVFLAQVRDRLIDRGLATGETISAAIAELETPSGSIVYGPILISVSGQVASSRGQ